jgi:hypothetical protein
MTSFCTAPWSFAPPGPVALAAIGLRPSALARTRKARGNRANRDNREMPGKMGIERVGASFAEIRGNRANVPAGGCGATVMAPDTRMTVPRGTMAMEARKNTKNTRKSVRALKTGVFETRSASTKKYQKFQEISRRSMSHLQAGHSQMTIPVVSTEARLKHLGVNSTRSGETLFRRVAASRSEKVSPLGPEFILSEVEGALGRDDGNGHMR